MSRIAENRKILTDNENPPGRSIKVNSNTHPIPYTVILEQDKDIQTRDQSIYHTEFNTLPHDNNKKYKQAEKDE